METVTIMGGDFPTCAQEGCEKLAQDGYCYASCCAVGVHPKAYCSEHSHRPTWVLEILGAPVSQETFTRAEVVRLVQNLWQGAPKVIESVGFIEMMKDLTKKRMERDQRAAGETPA